MKKDKLEMKVIGHLKCIDDQGTIHIDKKNAVHPQNLARVFARSLSNESNYFIHRIAFGNGGTATSAAYEIEYFTPNDGQAPDINTWDSRLYNETYSEIIDEGNISINPLLGTDPGSFDDAGNRSGGGSVPSGDPSSVPHVSGPGVRSTELGLTSQVVITVVLNPNEPFGQFDNDNLAPIENTETSFVFDEIGLYTTGAPASDTNGNNDVNVNNKNSLNDTGLLANTAYDFFIEVDGGTQTQISFTTPVGGGSGTGGEILYGDLCEAINTGDPAWNPAWVNVSPLPSGATISITDTTTSFTSISGSQTYGFLRFISGSAGDGSSIRLFTGTTNDLFNALGGSPITGNEVGNYIDGLSAGVQNDPVNPQNERERLLTHLIFSPVLKSANRTFTITYTLTIAIARSQ